MSFNFKSGLAASGLSDIADKIKATKEVFNEKVDNVKSGIANIQLPTINYGMTTKEKWQLAGLGAGLILLVYWLFGKKPKKYRSSKRSKRSAQRRGTFIRGVKRMPSRTKKRRVISKKTLRKVYG